MGGGGRGCSQLLRFSTYLPLIADLGANVVRLYNIDPEKSHDKFMRQAASLGLTVMVPLTRCLAHDATCGSLWSGCQRCFGLFGGC